MRGWDRLVRRDAVGGGVLLILAMALGVLARSEDLPAWRAHPQRAYMHDGRPVLIEFDGYRYLRYAEELLRGEYVPHDPLQKALTGGGARPQRPPLLSVLVAAASRGSGVEPIRVAAWMPVAVAVLSALPFWFLGLRFGGRMAAFCACVTALASPAFVVRSQYARFDTDCALPGFVVAVCLLAVAAVESTGRKRVAAGVGFAVASFLFLWWWDTAGSIVLGLVAVALACALLFAGRVRLRTRGAFLAVMAIGVFLLRDRLHFVADLARQLLESQAAGGATTADVIAEQQHMAPLGLARLATGSVALTLVAGIGLVLAACRHGRSLSALAPLLALAVLPFAWFQRFALFTAPAVAVGLAAVAATLTRCAAPAGTGTTPARHWRTWVCRILVLLLMSAVVGLPLRHLRANTQWPIVPPYAVYGMERVAEFAPANAVIWSWWDNGYHLQYYARRATIDDGGTFHIPEINAFPLTCTDFRQSANFMTLLATRGRDEWDRAVGEIGQERVLRILAEGPDGPAAVGLSDMWKTLLFPPRSEARPVCLYLNYLYLHTAYWWYWYGGHLTGDDRRTTLRPCYDVREEGDRLLGSEGFELDLRTGRVRLPSGETAVRRVWVQEGERIKALEFAGGADYTFFYDTSGRWGMLVSDDMRESVFVRLYFNPAFQNPHLVLRESRTPYFQIWEVRGEAWPQGH